MKKVAAVGLTVTVAIGAVSSVGLAQTQPKLPRGEFVKHHVESAEHDGIAGQAQVVFHHVVINKGALWTRLFFDEIELDRDSFVRVTSLHDGEVQKLDAQTAAMWQNTTAYFNGDSVLIELVAGAESQGNQFVLEKTAIEQGGMQISNHCTPPLCGICEQDDREPSEENWAGRLMPVGCSASIHNEQSCAVSAGHCMASNLVMQFNVPESTSNCNTQNPPVDDQFPVTSQQSQNGGVGADWAAMTIGVNGIGQTPYQRYGEFRPIASSVPSSGPIEIWGYGVSETCPLSQVQQRSTGSITSVDATAIHHNADTTCGNSGSAMLQNDQIIGIVTHCGCPSASNIANRIDASAFQNAIESVCPDPPSNDECSGSIQVVDGSTPFTNDGATTTGPTEASDCAFEGDANIQSDVWFHYTASCTGTATISLCDGDQPRPGGECAGHCNGQAPSGCWCDDLCDGFGDCCDDVCDDCPELNHCQDDPTGPCAGNCGGPAPEGCWCDDACDGFGDCCPNVCDDCPGLSHCASAPEGNHNPISGGSGFDTKLAVYGENCPTGSGEVLACNKDACGQLSELTLDVQAGETYRIRVGGHLGAQGDGILTVDCEQGAEPDCPADITGPDGAPDGTVDVFDMLKIINEWGDCPDPNDCSADITGPDGVPDGTVDVFDMLKVINEWGLCEG